MTGYVIWKRDVNTAPRNEVDDKMANTDASTPNGEPRETNLEKRMTQSRELRAKIAKSDIPDPGPRIRADALAKGDEIDYLRQHSGFWSNPEKVAQAEQVRKREAGMAE